MYVLGVKYSDKFEQKQAGMINIKTMQGPFKPKSIYVQWAEVR
jgi:hypothetical protein